MTRSMLGTVCVATLLARWPAAQLSAPALASVRSTVSVPNLRVYRERAWAAAGRPWLARYGGVRWDAPRKRWALDSAWTHAADASQEAYYLEYALRPELSVAERSRDVARLDELADFFLAYLPRFTTLGELRHSGGLTRSTRALDGQGPDATRTLMWIQPAAGGDEVRECTLCTSQLFHPAARLVRLIAQMPAAARTPRMTQFVHQYLPLLVTDHLLRLTFVAETRYWNARDLPPHLIDIWATLARTPKTRGPSYTHAMFDTDLWLTATAAELLGAAAANPSLVALGSSADSLRLIVQRGTALLEAKRHLHPETRDATGHRVGSVTFFDGDLDDYPDMAYARDTSAQYPKPSDRRPPVGGSWDSSHAYRIPVALRSLFDNRRATGQSYPSAGELRLVANQYTYAVFYGDTTRPSFHNYFDGHDGWFRVGYSGRRDFGYPPSHYCDTRNSSRPCLSDGAVMGWGQLAPWQPEIGHIEESLLRLATRSDPAAIEFRNRYYTYGREAFAFTDAAGRPNYPFLLFVLTAEYSGPFGA